MKRLEQANDIIEGEGSREATLNRVDREGLDQDLNNRMVLRREI